MTNLTDQISNTVRKYIAMLLEPIIGHSRMVSVTKKSLLVIAFILTAVLIILPFYNSMNKNFRITFTSVGKDANSNLPVMQNPHLQGVDGNGQAYNVTARHAIQGEGDRITLKELNADINLKDNGWISLSANEGLFDHANNTAELKGNINVYSHQGYELSTEEANINMKDSTLYGKGAIEGQGPFGTIRADSFSITNKGNNILLSGNVKVVIFSKK